MGYQCDFLDNVAYGAEQINAIRSTFATKGVIPDGEDSLAVTLEGSSIRINKGQALFEDGTRICIGMDEENPAEDSVTLAAISGTVNYIYLQRNKESNNPRPVVSDTPCGNEDILLAQIETDGTVLDKRVFSTLKVPMQSNHTQTITITVQQSVNVKAKEWIPVASVDLNDFGYHYLIFERKNPYTPYEIRAFGVQGMSDQTASGFYYYTFNDYRYYYAASTGIRNTHRTHYKFMMEGNKLVCYFSSDEAYTGNLNEGFQITLI